MKVKWKEVELDVFMEDENLVWIHPLTGQHCSDIDQALAGWSERDDNLNRQWDELRNLVLENIDTVEEFARDYCEIYNFNNEQEV